MIVMSERDKMLAGHPYDPTDPQLVAHRLRARTLWHEFNSLPPEASARAASILKDLMDAHETVTINAPFRCDYGYNIHIGQDTYLNYDCVILDIAPVKIGNRVLLGPGVHLYGAVHPMSAVERQKGLESGRPISIEDGVWIGGRAVICPGVTVGAGSVIGAGSVVTQNIPAGVFAAGNPCRVIRTLEAAAEEWRP
jgi:maltose O-acetyltransferase